MQDLDVALFALLNAGASVPPWSLELAQFASRFMPALLALAMGAGALVDRRWRHAFVTAMVSLLVVWLVVSAMRAWVPVPRPAFYGLGIQWVPQGARPGFPSMHAAGTFAAAFSLWCLPWRTPMLLALAAAAVVAWSRLYLGLHFPSDVMAAAVLGALVSIVVERVLSGQTGLTFKPTPLSGARSRGRRA
jgi:undecaprenyl-diphosphatase